MTSIEDRAALRRARVSTSLLFLLFGTAGFLTGPVLIGGVAELASRPVALAVPVVLALFVAGTASALRPAAVREPVL